MRLSTQIWGLIAAVVTVAILAGGWFLGVSPLLTVKASADTERANAESQNLALQAAITALAEQEKNFPAIAAEARQLEQAIPSDVGGADFIRTINDIAIANNVVVQSINFGDLTPYAAPAGDPIDPARAPNPLTDSRITPENFFLVPVSLKVTGGWNEVLAFTKGVQTATRLMLVTGVQTTAADGSFSTELKGPLYVLVRTPGMQSVTAGLAQPVPAPAPAEPAVEEPAADESTAEETPEPTDTASPDATDDSATEETD